MFMNYIITLFFLSTILYGDIHVFNRSAGTESEIRTLPNTRSLYISAKDLAKSFTSKVYENTERQKVVLYISGTKVKISGNSSYIIIDEKAYQMPEITIVRHSDLYLPAEQFLNILKSTILPGINFDSKKELLELSLIHISEPTRPY